MSQLFFSTRLGDGGRTWRGPHSLAEGCDWTFKVLSYFNESCYHLNCEMFVVSREIPKFAKFLFAREELLSQFAINYFCQGGTFASSCPGSSRSLQVSTWLGTDLKNYDDYIGEDDDDGHDALALVQIWQ